MPTLGDDLGTGLLVAVLAAHGGSIDLDTDRLPRAATHNSRGESHAVAVEALPSGRVRLSLVPLDELPPEA